MLFPLKYERQFSILPELTFAPHIKSVSALAISSIALVIILLSIISPNRKTPGRITELHSVQSGTLCADLTYSKSYDFLQ